MPANLPTSIRWRMLALVFFATTINYLDRIVFSVLNSVISAEMHIDDAAYGNINAAFQAAYTVGFLVAGRLIDRFGTRVGYAISIAWWSVSAALHAVARTPVELGLWRAMLGLGEAGNFPAAIKSVAEWFPQKDRAYATGLFNSGTTLASMLGPPLFVWMTLHLGWRYCFLITASTGFLWLVLWWRNYRLPQTDQRVSTEEREYILGDSESKSTRRAMPWLEAFTHRETWGFALAKFFTDPVWWFYLIWLPRYLANERHFDLKAIGWALPVVYAAAAVGSVGGGWLAGMLMRRGIPTGRARLISMAVCAACMPVGACAVAAASPVLAIFLVCFATAGHQGWSANLFTTTSDVFPKNDVATVTGIGSCFGGLGGTIFSALLPGYIVGHFGYTPMFVIMGTFHLVAWLLVRWLSGEMKPLEPGRMAEAR